MGADLDIAEEQSVFTARSVRLRLQVEPSKRVAAYRDTLVWGRDRLYAMFTEGAPAESLVRARAFLVDEVLRGAWKAFLGDTQPQGLTLVAVGGYGRGELLPHSDIDLLVLHDTEALSKHQPQLESMMAFFWDIGLDVGAAVRSVDDCVDQARDDLTVFTNLTEHRLLTGDAALLEALAIRLAPDQIWPVNAFFRAKMAEQAARYRKYDDTGYKLEPNVKESPGGLRDIQTIAWVAKRHFGAQTLSELRTHDFLSKQECDELYAGQDFLWRVRFALHMLTGRKEDRLLFDHQIRVAQLFGYVDEDATLAVEQFMQLYYRTIKALSCLNDMLLQLFEQAILRTGERSDDEPLNQRFTVRDGFIETRRDDVFRQQPWALIEIFFLLQRHPNIQGISANTLRQIRRDRKLVDEGLRGDVRARALFIGMFREGRGLTRALRRMNRYGVLGRYLPVFGQVIGHMQYDLFHTLTVDEHTLYVLRNLRRMAMQRFRDELPFASEVMEHIQRKELLYIAGLFHDLGKGRGGDHSELGAHDAIQFCLDHGLSHADADLVAWLVRNHLLMSLTAQRMDISDPEIVADFAARVGNRQRLDHLFLLTCADIRATNPKLWNTWRASLLNELYQSTARALERGLGNPVSPDELIREKRSQALEISGVDAETADKLWARFEDDYFLRHTPGELAWHLPELLAADPDKALVLVRTLEDHGSSVFVYTRDRDHLFAVSTGVLAQLGLSILDARLNTTADGYTLDSYVVLESDGNAISTARRHEEIRVAMAQALSREQTTPVTVSRRATRLLRHFNTPTTVYFGDDEAHQRTIMELVSGDQPGLLSRVGNVFAEHAIRLDAAKIATIGERAEDVFYITDRDKRPLRDSAQLDALRQAVIDALNHSN
jgi:[protein-PII] uridylyltransferase